MRQIELRHLRYFVAVAQAGSVMAGARAAGIVQPALSRQIRELEEAIGTPLLIRRATGVTLTAAGTSLVKDLNAGSGGSAPRNFAIAGGKVCFAAASTGNFISGEAWVSDGTAAGTRMVQAGIDVAPTGFTGAGDNIVFVGNSRLTRTQGTLASTVDIHPPGVSDWHAPTANWPSLFTAIGGGRVLFKAEHLDAYGKEFWTTDGTPAGTSVLDVTPVSYNGNPGGFAELGGVAYFVGNSAAMTPTAPSGQLWRTDGSAVGTTLVADVNPGAGSAFPGHMLLARGDIVFTADDGVTGSEPWAVFPGASAQPIGAPCGANAGLPVFEGTDPVLGPEMKSTGEVMGLDSSFERAFAKAQLGAGVILPMAGQVFLSIKDADKKGLPALARRLKSLPAI